MPTNHTARLNRVLIALVITLLVTQLLTLKALRQNKVNTAEDMDQAGDSEVPGVSCTATVRVRWLNQRSGPNESSPITGGARRGEAMIGIGWNESRQWLLVSTSNGSAWMYASYMRLSGGCDSLPVYSAENGSVEPEAQSQRQPHCPRCSRPNTVLVTTRALRVYSSVSLKTQPAHWTQLV